MLEEPRDLTAETVLAAVRTGWDAAVTWVEHAPVGTAAFHWRAGTAHGNRWFVTADPVPDAEDRDRRADAYAASAQLSAAHDFVLAPVPGLHGEAVRAMPPHYLLSVAPYVECASLAHPETAGFPDDDARSEVAAMLARVHTGRRPVGIPTWQPRVGWRGTSRRREVDRVRSATTWDAGPLSAPAWRVVTGAAPMLDRALRRFDLLAAAAVGTASAWVPTHGEPHAANVLGTAGGLRLGTGPASRSHRPSGTCATCCSTPTGTSRSWPTWPPAACRAGCRRTCWSSSRWSGTWPR